LGKLIINGGSRLEGEIKVQGAKNAVLPILAATVLNGEKNVITNCPHLSDVEKTIDVLESLGCTVCRQGNALIVDSSNASGHTIAEELMRQMRSSIIFLGAIIARFGKAVVSMPGGCEIGNRPIDLHLKALEQLGIHIEEEHGYIYCTADKLAGADIHLDFPSVGATENIMLASCMADGTTTITNAAREPEIIDLGAFLTHMGADVRGAGTDVIRIEGVKKLYGIEHEIIPDRIVAATYLAAGAATGGTVSLRGANAGHMEAMLSAFREMGCDIACEKSRLILAAPKKLKHLHTVRTLPYPGFPTDIQSPFMTLASIAGGTTVFVETIFENRYKHVEELTRMGADIKVDGRVAIVRGVDRLSGANVVAKDLRGGAALTLAALAADGTTEIENTCYIDRGYECIERELAALGADIKRTDI
jgi:UDP-N-acetylglucosamine 1-carboxyvinyltransferase